MDVIGTLFKVRNSSTGAAIGGVIQVMKFEPPADVITF